MIRIFALTLTALKVLNGCPDQGVPKFSATPKAAILSHIDGDEVLEACEVTFTGSAANQANAAARPQGLPGIPAKTTRLCRTW